MWLRGDEESPQAEAASVLLGEFVLRGLAWLKANQEK